MRNTPLIPKSRLSQAITMALLTGALVPAAAFADSCETTGVNTLSTAQTEMCYLDEGDSLTITPAGSITTTNDNGVFTSATGTVTNDGVISAKYNGIYVYGSSDVVNNGTITAEGQGIYVYLADGNNITNTGSIIADTNDGGIGSGVYIYGDGVLGDFNNSGLIQGVNGIYVYGGDNTMASFTNSGVIIGEQNGIYIYGGSDATLDITGDFINSGTIQADDAFGVYLYGSIGGDLINSGLVKSAYSGIYVFGFDGVGGDVINSGTIQAGSNGIYIYGGIGGDLTNSGTIQTSDTGIYVYGDVVGDVLNSGLVESAYTGIYVYGDVGGNVTNTGTINSQDDGDEYGHGIYIHGDVGGEAANSGLIEAETSGFYVYGDVAGNFSNTGTIIADSGRGMFARNVDGDVTNSGTIIADGWSGIYVYGVAGDVVNSGTIIADDNGLYTYGAVTGDVINSGTIIAGDKGIYVHGDVGGDILNSGLIESDDTGIYVYQSSVVGSVINSGTITSENERGIYIYGGTIDGDVINSGLIEAYDSGIYVFDDSSIAGSVINSGTIISEYARGIYVHGDVGGDVINSGLIESDDSGIYVYGDVGGSVTNSGLIISDEEKGIYLYGGVGGSVINSGTIIAEDAGIYIYHGNVGGDVINSGLIISDSGRGMYIYADVGGEVLNSGNIESYYAGVYVYGDVAGSVTNSGNITASSGRGMYVYGTVAGNVVNSGTITSESWDGITLGYGSVIEGDFVNSGVINADDDGMQAYYADVNGDLVNSGVINSGVDSGAGIYLTNSTVLGNIVNSGVINSDDAGISIDSSSTVEGKVINSGSINGYFDIDSDVDVENTGFINTQDDSSYVEGNYSQTVSGELRVGVFDEDDHGSFDVNGAASFAKGTTLSVSGSSALVDGDLLEDVITSSDLEAVASDFKIKDNMLSRSFTAVIDGENVDLEVNDTGLTTVAAAVESSRLNTGAGAALDAIIGENPEGDVAYGFGSLNSVKEVADAVETTLPALAGGLAQASLNTGRQLTGIIGARQAGMASGDETPSNEGIWVKYVSGAADQDGAKGVSGYDVDSMGIAVGTDRDISATWNLGYALSFIQNEIDSGAGQSVDSDALIGKVYATRDLKDSTQLNLQLGLGTVDNDGQRKVFTGATASSDYDSKLLQASAELTRSYERSEKTSYAPYVSLDFSKANVEGYNESGAGALNLNVGSTSSDSLVLGVGARGSHAASDKVELTGIIGLGYDMQADNSSVTSSFQGGGARFSTQGIEPESFAYNLGLGASYDLNDATELSANYDLTNRSDYSDKIFSLKAKWNF